MEIRLGNLLVSAAVCGLVAGCGSASSPDPAATGHGSGAAPRPPAAHHPVTVLTSSDGFRFKVSGAGAHTTPTDPDGDTASPGQAYVYAEIDVTNLQKDRGGPLGDFLSDLLIAVPQAVVPDGGRAYACELEDDGMCMRTGRWTHADADGGTDDLVGLGSDPETSTVPPGGTWTVRGYFGAASPVDDTHDVGRVQLFWTPNIAEKFLKKSDPRTAIPLS